MPTYSLPDRPSVEQLKKRAKTLLRAVRAGAPGALRLFAEFHPDPHGPEYSLDSAQLVTARMYGFASWPRLRQHIDRVTADRLAGMPPSPRTGSLTAENRYRVRAGRVSAADVRRCAAIADARYGDPSRWRQVLTAQHNGATVVAFHTAAGPLFGELTPTTVTLSRPDPAPDDRTTLLFHTAFGTLAGSVAPGVAAVGLERPVDRRARESAVVVDGLFVVPNAFTVTDAGLVLRVDHARVGEIVPVGALPTRAVGVVDRPAPAADRSSPAGRRLTDLIAAADAPPLVDPDQWAPGVDARLTATEQLLLARYRNLLAWTLDRPDEPDDLFVLDFTPRQGPVRDLAVRGDTIMATRLYYDFWNGSSGAVAVVGLMTGPAATVELHRSDGPVLTATVHGGTFLVAAPDLTDLREEGPVAERLVVRDARGQVLEDLPYQHES